MKTTHLMILAAALCAALTSCQFAGTPVRGCVTTGQGTVCYDPEGGLTVTVDASSAK